MFILLRISVILNSVWTGPRAKELRFFALQVLCWKRTSNCDYGWPHKKSQQFVDRSRPTWWSRRDEETFYLQTTKCIIVTGYLLHENIRGDPGVNNSLTSTNHAIILPSPPFILSSSCPCNTRLETLLHTYRILYINNVMEIKFIDE